VISSLVEVVLSTASVVVVPGMPVVVVLVSSPEQPASKTAGTRTRTKARHSRGRSIAAVCSFAVAGVIVTSSAR
jgi:hypothetical protein